MRGYRHRYMFYLTGLPGWIRFGFSPGWQGIPPTTQYIMQSGQLPQFINYSQTPLPNVMPSTAMTKEEEISMLEQQVNMIEQQIKAIEERIRQLKEG
ncbi:MAG TPA: hypothetical protein ENI33_06720 [Thermoplasmatales archaeon]|nr:hypothetical protein [Thermoplasmatales archaeon]